MSWADIELKWAAMTRRIGADRTQYDNNPVIARTPPLPPYWTRLPKCTRQVFLKEQTRDAQQPLAQLAADRAQS